MLNVLSAKKNQTNPSISNANIILATLASKIMSQSKPKGICLLTKQTINQI